MGKYYVMDLIAEIADYKKISSKDFKGYVIVSEKTKNDFLLYEGEWTEEDDFIEIDKFDFEHSDKNQNCAIILSADILDDKEFMEKHKHIFYKNYLVVALTSKFLTKNNTGKTIENLDLKSVKNDIDNEYLKINDEEPTIDEFLNLPEKRENALLALKDIVFDKETEPKDIYFKESIDADLIFDINELDNAKNKVLTISNYLNSLNLSPAEKMHIAHSYVYAYKYEKSSLMESSEKSRALLSVLNQSNIVCTGKSMMLCELLNLMGIPSILRNGNGHTFITSALNDEKYKKYGIYDDDVTNKKRLFLINDANPIRQELLPFEYINKLTDEQKDNLYKKSGLDKIDQNKITQCAQEDYEHDEKVANTKDYSEKYFNIENNETVKNAYAELSNLFKFYTTKESNEDDHLGSEYNQEYTELGNQLYYLYMARNNILGKDLPDENKVLLLNNLLNDDFYRIIEPMKEQYGKLEELKKQLKGKEEQLENLEQENLKKNFSDEDIKNLFNDSYIPSENEKLELKTEKEIENMKKDIENMKKDIENMKKDIDKKTLPFINFKKNLQAKINSLQSEKGVQNE